MEEVNLKQIGKKWLREPDYVAEDVYHAIELIFS